MKLKEIVFISVSAFALCTSFNASAFGLGNLTGGSKDSGKSGNVEKDIDTFIKTADEAHALTSKSVRILGDALLTKEDMKANADTLEAANKIQDDKEREAAKTKADEELNAKLAKVDYDAKSKEIGKMNDAKQKSQLGASMFNFVLGLLKDKDLVNQGNGLVSSASSNLMMVTKLVKVKDAISSISGQLGNMGKIASGLQKLNSVIKTTPLPTSSTSQPVSASD